MKKLIALFLALSLLMTAAFALAEETTDASAPAQQTQAVPGDLPAGTPPDGAPTGMPPFGGFGPMGPDRRGPANGQAPNDEPVNIDFDVLVAQGIISQETADSISAYLSEHTPTGEKPADLPELPSGEKPADAPELPSGEKPADAPELPSGEKPADAPELPSGEKPADAPELPSGEKPADLPEMKGNQPQTGILNDLLQAGIITQAEYEAISAALTVDA